MDDTQQISRFQRLTVPPAIATAQRKTDWGNSPVATMEIPESAERTGRDGRTIKSSK
jgi:hypothetical protein